MDKLPGLDRVLYSRGGELVEDEIFQYCSISTFKSMIEKKELWLTHYAAMNDAKECQILNDRLHSWRKDMGDGLDEGDWKRFLREYMKKAFKEIYLSCFSLERDLLSQWRAYADDGRGFSVGFKWKDLKAEPYKLPLKDKRGQEARTIWPVVYNEKTQDGAIRKLLTPDKIRAAVEEPGAFYDLFIQLRCLSLIYKNKGFTEEKEVRVILTPAKKGKKRLLNNQDHPWYRVSASSLSPYYVLTFEPATITRLTLGPATRPVKTISGIFSEWPGLIWIIKSNWTAGLSRVKTGSPGRRPVTGAKIEPRPSGSVRKVYSQSIAKRSCWPGSPFSRASCRLEK